MPRKRKADADDEDNNAPQYGCKKSKNPPAAVDRFTKLPRDVHLEIFGYIDPLDLLHFARLTKELRAVLVDKASVAVWKAVCRNAELPGPPEGVSEPAWISLIYESRCHHCQKYVRFPDFSLRIRICHACAKVHLREVQSIYLCRTQEEVTISRLIVSMIPLEYVKITGGRKSWDELYFLPKDFEAVRAKLISLKPEETEAYIAERKQFVRSNERAADYYRLWYDRRPASNVSIDAKIGRIKAIREKLIAMGYENELNNIRYPDNFFTHPLVNQTRALTDRIWANIKDKLVTYMESMKLKRLARERMDVVNSRKTLAVEILREFKNTFSPSLVLPSLTDFLNSPLANSILELPSEVEVTHQTFAPVTSGLSAFCIAWRHDVHRRLAEFVIGPGSTLSADDKLVRLQLASTVFLCRRCHLGAHKLIPLMYPDTITHQCLTISPLKDAVPSDPARRLNSKSYFARDTWNTDCLMRDETLCRVTQGVVRSMGFNPETASTAQLDISPLLLECQSCPRNRNADGTHTSVAYGWRALVRHFYEKHRSGPASTVNAAVIKDGRVLESGSSVKCLKAVLFDQVFLSTHCRDLPCEDYTRPFDGLIKHITDTHHIQVPRMTIDWYEEFAWSKESMHPRLKVDICIA
ncbi:uncharacterized protein EV420DRAFT_1524036 [Desarmillaria tabescens]|uniref:F-box domain-containing protein n=1 Tax=Armillaria tabescens TaxID=1929756 RepID=A0AA39NB82_ARMTA|nr:uncharacterized protein EV420DRAFT_1524036 [Desarmillaria tabescens]KAK0462338.1 hypothetical protein EV420DRAFT_1524036 [Desarmillaria tabescens]